jgi:hypothetical protein
MEIWTTTMSKWPQDSTGLQMGSSAAHGMTTMLIEIGVGPAAGSFWVVSLGGSIREEAEPLPLSGITVEDGSGESHPNIAECQEGAPHLLLVGKISV